MIATMASEWIKLRTVRSHLVMLVIAVVFPLIVVALATSLSSTTSFDSRDTADLVTGVSIVSVFLLGTVSAISLTSEFSHGTIRPTFAATPSHLRVFVAKMGVNAAVTFVVIAVLLASNWLLASLILSGRGRSVVLSWSDGTLGAMVSLVALAVIVSWFALGLGLVLRSTPAAVTLLLLWPLLVENLVALVGFLAGFEGLGRWMPYSSALSAVSPNAVDDSLGRPWAFVWFGTVALVVVGIGWALDRRRDA